MNGAAWNPKKKTLEEEWHELVIMKPEYYDLDVENVKMVNIITRETVGKELFDLIIDDFLEMSRDDQRRGSTFYTQFIFEINAEYFAENPELWGFWESNPVIRCDYNGWENSDVETLTRVEKKTKTVIAEEWVPVE